MYQHYFRLTAQPFALTPDTRFFCQAPPHQEALSMVLACLEQGEGFIKIVGEIGSGKTLLCRRLLAELAQGDFVTAYIPNPAIKASELTQVLARELGILTEGAPEGYLLHEQLMQRLILINQNKKTVVLIIDEAQAMPDETLEALRLLTNLETETHKLLQIILLGQPELDVKLSTYSLRQLQQRIAFTYYLKTFTPYQTAAYIQHRLIIAGHTYGALFTEKAILDIHRASCGLPRVINILAHKALLTAYGKGLSQVNRACVKQAIHDTALRQWTQRPSLLKRLGWFIKRLCLGSAKSREPS